MLTIAECVAAGGHHWADGARGVLGDLSEYEQRCTTCPAGRMGHRPSWKSDAEIAWAEPYNRVSGPYPWRELSAEELREAFRE